MPVRRIPYGRNLGFLDRTSLEHLHKVLHCEYTTAKLVLSCLLRYKKKTLSSIKKNAETLIDASMEVGLEINTEKTKYMLLSHHQNMGQTNHLKMCHSPNILERQ
jgi:hypothetical protein